MTTLIDGNTFWVGFLVDNILGFFANVFGGLATFGNVLGILMGVAFVLGLILVVVGKIKISDILGNFS